MKLAREMSGDITQRGICPRTYLLIGAVAERDAGDRDRVDDDGRRDAGHSSPSVAEAVNQTIITDGPQLGDEVSLLSGCDGELRLAPRKARRELGRILPGKQRLSHGQAVCGHPGSDAGEHSGRPGTWELSQADCLKILADCQLDRGPGPHVQLHEMRGRQVAHSSAGGGRAELHEAQAQLVSATMWFDGIEFDQADKQPVHCRFRQL